MSAVDCRSPSVTALAHTEQICASGHSCDRAVGMPVRWRGDAPQLGSGCIFLLQMDGEGQPLNLYHRFISSELPVSKPLTTAFPSYFLSGINELTILPAQALLYIFRV